MERWKRIIYYLLINVVVSACTILTVLFAWEQVQNRRAASEPSALFMLTATVPAVEAGATDAAAPLVATPTNEPEPTLSLETYTVVAGDTLGQIATRFDVALEDLIAVNGIEDADVLEVGDVLYIPGPGEVPTPVPEEPTAQPTANQPVLPPDITPAPTSTPLPPGQTIDIEVVTVVGVGTLEDERVIIRLISDGELMLQGWILQDEQGNAFSFPQLTLYGQGAVTIFTKTGSDSVVELYWGRAETVWEEGEKVYLFDQSGTLRAEYQIP
jgi:LysM repeat protein